MKLQAKGSALAALPFNPKSKAPEYMHMLSMLASKSAENQYPKPFPP